ncbi:MAG: prepilin peptidase [Candidatus Faecimonas sp.]|nr:prepilin peptidase [Mycoplasmatota bacterium]MDY2907902.1 prepilin peptidase [Candidatus Faecimonas sp.]
MDSLYLIIFFILGTILGGFYTVLGNHLAQEDYHFLPYQCDSCKHNLSILDVIPFFSYLFLKGKCKYCHEKIDVMEPLMEVFTGILFAVAYYSFGFSYDFLIALGIVSLLIIVTVSDLNYLIIPDEVLVFFILYFVIVQFFSVGVIGVVEHLLTGMFLFVLMYIIMWLGEKLLNKESLGGGDVKMMFLFGLVLDPLLGTVAIFLGSLFALPMSLFLLYKNNEKMIPFGPFLLIAFTFLYFTKITPEILVRWFGF